MMQYLMATDTTAPLWEMWSSSASDEKHIPGTQQLCSTDDVHHNKFDEPKMAEYLASIFGTEKDK